MKTVSATFCSNKHGLIGEKKRGGKGVKLLTERRERGGAGLPN